MNSIQEFQRRLFKRYKSSLSLPKNYRYFYGNPVEPVVPLDTKTESVLIIGAYPSAKFATIDSETNAPVADNLGPFSSDRYFDGSRVRSLASGHELYTEYLRPLGLQRTQCWITDLVKVFLFKQGHIEKYHRLGCKWPDRETRSLFEQYANESKNWLKEELQLANPKLIITLGTEVAGILQNVRGQSARNALLGGKLRDLKFEDLEYPVIHLAHPGIIMRPATERNQWPRLHREKHIPEVKKIIKRLSKLNKV